MEQAINKRVAKEILIILAVIVLAYVLTALYGGGSDYYLKGIDIVRIQGVGHFLRYRLFISIDNSYFFTVITILYSLRLAIWAVITLLRKTQPNSPEKGI